jgi:hypothetical protein
MTKRPDDKTPEPPGGRAAKRLEMFEEARRPNLPKGTSDKTSKKTRPAKTEGEHEEPKRRKD